MNSSNPKRDVEKIKPPKWTLDNTAETQRIVDDVARRALALRDLFGRHIVVVNTLVSACRRFKALDPKVVLPSWMVD